jgi:hypothetical protein
MPRIPAGHSGRPTFSRCGRPGSASESSVRWQPEGRGHPVCETADDRLDAVEAVVEKELIGAVLALALGAGRILNLTSVERVKLSFGAPGGRRSWRRSREQQPVCGRGRGRLAWSAQIPRVPEGGGSREPQSGSSCLESTVYRGARSGHGRIDGILARRGEPGLNRELMVLIKPLARDLPDRRLRQ